MSCWSALRTPSRMSCATPAVVHIGPVAQVVDHLFGRVVHLVKLTDTGPAQTAEVKALPPEAPHAAERSIQARLGAHCGAAGDARADAVADAGQRAGTGFPCAGEYQ